MQEIKALITFPKCLSLKNNLGLLNSFSAVTYAGKIQAINNNSINFSIQNSYFRNVDTKMMGIKIEKEVDSE